MKAHSIARAAIASVLLASGAQAHPAPRAASPAPNAVLATPPREIRITFSEGLVAAFSGLTLKNAAGVAVPLGPASVGPSDKRQLAAPLTARLSPGAYTVYWHVVGDDTHHVSGRYSFQVK